ncbi:MAG: hypothetical protein WC788_07560 [Candidatus Paceibacterota bacterium]|jgi:hypothetical protein
MSNQETVNTKLLTAKQQDVLADIEIARAGFLMFKDFEITKSWTILLTKAEEAIICNQENEVYSKKIIKAVNQEFDKNWKEFLKLNIIDLIARFLVVEIIVASLYYASADVLKYGIITSIIFGLLGGILSVVRTLGQDLKAMGPNDVKLYVRVIFRPFVGSMAAIVAYVSWHAGVIKILPDLNQADVLILLSIAAGLSERFITYTLSACLPNGLKVKEGK